MSFCIIHKLSFDTLNSLIHFETCMCSTNLNLHFDFDPKQCKPNLYIVNMNFTKLIKDNKCMVVICKLMWMPCIDFGCVINLSCTELSIEPSDQC